MTTFSFEEAMGSDPGPKPTPSKQTKKSESGGYSYDEVMGGQAGTPSPRREPSAASSGTGALPESGYFGGSRETADQQRALVLQEELKNPNMSEQDRAAVTRELQRMNITPPQRQSTPQEIAKLNKSQRKNEAKKDKINTVAGIFKSLNTVANDILGIADMGLSLPGMALGVGAEAGSRLRQVIEDPSADPKKVKQRAADVGNRVTEAATNPLEKLVRAASPDRGKGYSESHVSKVMGKITEKLDDLGDFVETHTNGAITKEDINLTAKGTMVFGGAKLGDMSAKPKPERVDVAKLSAEQIQEKNKRIKDAQDKIVPATGETVQQTIDRVAGVKDDNARKQAHKQAKKDLQKAFPDDQVTYTKYVKDVTEKEAEAKAARQQPAAAPKPAETPKPAEEAKPVEAEIKADDPLITSAMNKIRNQKETEVTPEERAAVDKLTAQYQKKYQTGNIDQKLMANIALVGGGAAVGVYLDPDNKIQSAILGALGGGALSHVTPANVKSAFAKIREPDARIRITEEGNVHEEYVTKALVAQAALQNKIIDLVPDKVAREKIFTYLEQPGKVQLTGKELEAAKMVRQYFDGMLQEGVKAGVIKNARDNYITHLVDFGAESPGFMESLFGQIKGQGMSPKSPFGQGRKFATAEELEKAGYKLKTKDVVEIMGQYGNSMSRAIANANLIKAVKQGRAADGTKLAVPFDKAPKNYVQIDHPQMRGYAVHPDIAPSMKFLFDAKTPEGAMKALEILNTVSKRMKVSFSLFHATALSQGAMGAMGMIKAGKTIGRIAMGRDTLLNQLRKDGVGPEIDLAIEGGLKFSLPKVSDSMVDIQMDSFNQFMKTTQNYLDKTIPGSGKVVEGVQKVNHAVDEFMWGRLHAGLKLNMFMDKFNQLKENNVKAHESNPAKTRLLSDKELASMAASFTNDIEGGINWRRIAEGMESRWGRDLALKAFSPSSQRVMRLLFFAPDWLMSTTRSFTKAFGEGSGPMGVLKPETVADLHRQYQLRSAFYYLMFGDAINYSMSGHHVWENKDWTKIDLGDGRYMRLSKHFTDPYELAHSPETILGKMGAGPQVLMAESKSVSKGEGLTAKPIIEQYTPFSVGSSADTTSSMVGVPIYGKTHEEREQAKREKKRQHKPKKRKESDKEKYRP